MRVVALLLLCSCAPVAVATPIPSSLPYVRLDESLPGAVVSREAAVAILMRQERAKAACKAQAIECEARAEIARLALAEQTMRANKAAWWSTWGPVLLLSGILGSLAAGFGVGFAAGGR